MPLAAVIKTTGTRKQNFESKWAQRHSKHRTSRLGKGRKGSARFEVWVFIFLSLLSLVDQTAAIFKPLEPRINFENKTFTACSHPLTECPRSDNQKMGRELCMFGYGNNGCPTGTYYGCGVDEKTGFLVEDCFEKHLCPPGTSNRVRLNLDTKKSFLECSGCDKDHFQPYTADSSVETFTGCQEERSSVTLENEMYTMILIEEGWPTRPDKYSCNVALNYSDANQHMYCFVNRPCHCAQDFCCDPSTPDLLPNRSCDAKCAVDRLPLQNYSCPRYLDRGQPQEPVSADNFTTEEPSSNSTEIPTLWIVLAFVVVFLAVGVAGFCCFIQYRRRRPRERRDEQLNEGCFVLFRRRRHLDRGGVPQCQGNVEEPLVAIAVDGNRVDDNEIRAENGDENDMQDAGPDSVREHLVDNEVNDRPDDRNIPGRENPAGHWITKKIVKENTMANNQIIIKEGKHVHIHFPEQRNDENRNKHPRPVHIATKSSNNRHSYEEPNLTTPIQEEGCGLDKNSDSDISIPLMDADSTDEETKRKEMISSAETELKIRIQSEETKPKVLMSSEEVELQELKEVRK